MLSKNTLFSLGRLVNIFHTFSKRQLPNLKRSITERSLYKHYTVFLAAAPFFNRPNSNDLNLNEIDIKTLSESERSLSNLLVLLKDSIKEASEEYRRCLQKQIEITKAATEHGQLSERWDDIPEYRLMANALKQELEKYVSLINTLGAVANDKSIPILVTKPEDIMLINVQFAELKETVVKEIEENKKYEKILLEATCDSIAKGL